MSARTEKLKPALISQAMGLYCAERCEGAFRNHFITFSANPRLVELKGADIVEVVRYCRTFNEVAATNIQRVLWIVMP